MPKQCVARETVLDAALCIVRSKGEAALSARAIAEVAGCSVQPIYSLFGDMPGLVGELYDHARAWVAAYNRDHAHDGANLFESNGFSHLRLAKTETNLFRFLYLSPHMHPRGFEELYQSVALDGVVECIQELGHLSEKAAHELYLNMIVYTHGMAAMIACGAQFTERELHERIDRSFRAFVCQVREGEGESEA